MATLRQRGVAIPAPGGNELSQDADRVRDMDRYVHLCFRNTHSMEFVARQAGRIADTIFLQIHPEVLQWEGVRFTPDVSNKAGVCVYTIEEAKRLIDFDILYTRTNWKDPPIKARLDQAETCEILVPEFIPVKLIRNLPNGMKKELLEESTRSPSDFIRVVSRFDYHPHLRVEERAAESLFASG
jgi:hypothetical protein